MNYDCLHGHPCTQVIVADYAFFLFLVKSNSDERRMEVCGFYELVQREMLLQS